MGKDHKKKKKLFHISAAKFALYLVITLILLVSWGGTPWYIKFLALGYFVFRFVALAADGFACGHCWLHLIMALAFMILALGLLPSKFYVLAILLLWAEAIIP